MKKVNELTKIIRKKYPTAGVYLVGGGVRDKLMQRKSADYDVVVTNVPFKELQSLLAQFGKIKLIGKSFGVLMWNNIDIALPRTEKGWGTGRRRDVSVQYDPKISITEDLSRRDFTINAIAYDLIKKKYIDPYNGQKDIQKKLIRTVGKPQERFREDASRVIRALRFAEQFHFTVDPETWKAIKKNTRKISRVAPEIIAKEFITALSHNPIGTIETFDSTGILERLIPEIQKMKACRQPKRWHTEGNVWVHSKLALSTLQRIQKGPWDPNLALAVLFHDIGKPAARKKEGRRVRFKGHDKKGADIISDIIRRLTLETAGINRAHIAWIVRHHMLLCNNDATKLKNTTVEKYFLTDKDPEGHLLTVMECDTAATFPEDPTVDTHNQNIRDIKRRIKELRKKPKKSLLNGDDIMKLLKLKPGKKVGQILEELREAMLSGTVRTKNEAQKFVKTL